MKTIITAQGKILQHGDQGVIVVSENGKVSLEISEVSDDQVTNLFGTIINGKLLTPNMHPGCGPMVSDFEILG